MKPAKNKPSKSERPVINATSVLQKFSGKGGWTFARVPEIKREEKIHTLKLKGTIDDYPVKKFGLMSTAQGALFMPIKAEIRKAIKKEAGDTIKVILYLDNDPVEIPIDLLLCLEEEPAAYSFFKTLSESEQMFYIKWIEEAKREETKTDRLAKTINKLVKGLKLYEKEK